MLSELKTDLGFQVENIPIKQIMCFIGNIII